MKHTLLNIILLIATLGFLPAQAQDKVTGTVRDARGNAPLKGVVVNLLGSKGVSAFTAEDGSFEIPISTKQEVALDFAFADYRSRRVYLNGRSNVDVLLVPADIARGPEMLRTSAGVQAPSDYNGSAVTLTRQQIAQRGYSTLENALQGMVPGLYVATHSGVTGAGGSLDFRGVSTMAAGNRPLVVVDGVILETNLGGLSAVEGYAFNPLVNINIRDIEQVTFVKDGMASVYGSLASNGVILIHTADSDVKETRVDFTANFGAFMKPQKASVLDARGYRNLALEQMVDKGITQDQIEDRYPYMIELAEGADAFRFGNDTDWQDEVLTAGVLTNYSASIEGGDEVASYNFSVGYTNNDGAVENTGVEVFDLAMGARIRMLKGLLIRPKVSLSKIGAELMPESYTATVNPVLASRFKSPMMGIWKRSERGYSLPFYDEVSDFGMSNPVSLVANSVGNHDNFRLKAGISATQNIFSGLTADFDLMADLFNMKENAFIPETGSVPQFDGQARNTMKSAQRKHFSIIGQLGLNYNKTFGFRHRVNAKVGTRVRINDLEEEMAVDINSPSDQFVVIGRGDGSFRQLTPNNGKWNMLTFYGNAGYAYLDRYYLDVNMSVDGSSKFAAGERYAYFPSVQGAWRLSSEPFMAGLKALDDLRLRASYGRTGNGDIGFYSARFYYVGVPYLDYSGTVRGGVPNTGLKWETTDQLNIGLDLSLFDGFVKLGADVYQRKTNDLLTAENLTTFYGSELLLSNGGSVENSGFELSMDFDLIRGKDFGFGLGATFSKNTNEVTQLGKNALTSAEQGVHQVTAIPGGELITKVGGSINSFYGFQSSGVIPSVAEAERLNLKDRFGNPFRAGDIAFVDMNKDNVIDEKDKTEIGSPLPDFFGSVSARARYKKLRVDVLFDYVYGNEIYNHVRKGMESMDGYYNQSTAVERRWRKDGQQTDIPRASFGDPMGNGRFSDRWIEDGSFVRLKNVTISYDFGVKNRFIRNLTGYLSANNLITFSDYLGDSPDISYSNDLNTRGVDYGRVPPLTSVLLGVKMGI
ncbi:SusC/RagA family TonB-linked outer membrane protein (plasmid) [Fulvitalea axinellae]|uniref:SusC/RagA family TonB-linked outer membrane protein n=1 Tax=Fulvitalea axinellae TaxID=1182444 RepID=A0AAU9D9R0_9BACT|nr:SusC/RagA family TonB-linked outer membrane protein [Fulvitalea axinellae]